ncbi:HAMP domain-containing histidine kinase [Rhizobium sp. NLR14b]|uniref:sensor histidine kinase n=1 Tax=Rhizobium sp. NLR14b TaxID=2731110 RepID=UPI001C8336DF|nr:HAMP domain-containing sensor histidine kinase [Rhizobium sp. NLR14b]MBX5307018.1 HAMP domain-containing histidine kinase [Rhizobium sp. NLR14b]
MARNLIRQMMLAAFALILVAYCVTFFGCVLYGKYLLTRLSYEDELSKEMVFLQHLVTLYAKYLLQRLLYEHGPLPEEKVYLHDLIIVSIILSGPITTAFVAGYCARRIAKPLKAVANAARLIADGNLSARIPRTRNSFAEANAATTEFNLMADELQTAEAELKYSSSVIAHELSTPLTILLDSLLGLSEGSLEPSTQRFDRLRSIVANAERILEDLRNLSLATAGTLKINPAEIDLAIEAETLMSLTESMLEAAGVTLKRDLSSAIVLADPARIRQAMIELVRNACLYAPGSTVTILTGQTEHWTVIGCSDTGPGLPLDARGRAFDRFWRYDESGAHVGGSGLGLANVKAVALAHGGDAIIDNSSGRGLAVEIRLPKSQVA